MANNIMDESAALGDAGEENAPEERTDAPGEEETAEKSTEKAKKGPSFPFPVFFLPTAQYPYVMKRVRQIHRQAMLDLRGDDMDSQNQQAKSKGKRKQV